MKNNFIKNLQNFFNPQNGDSDATNADFEDEMFDDGSFIEDPSFLITVVGGVRTSASLK